MSAKYVIFDMDETLAELYSVYYFVASIRLKETIEEDNPWSYIGYWGDHQIIYLLKFLEFSEKYFPNSLDSI